MSKTKPFLDNLAQNPLPLLRDKAPLAVRYHTLQTFYPQEEDQIEQIAMQLQTHKERAQLINSQQDDGRWQLHKDYTIEEKQKAMLFLLQLKNMTKLLDLGCNKELDATKKGIIGLLKLQKPDGKFPLNLHHHGFALYLLSQYGLSANPFVEKGFRWISKRQREDGGWLSLSMLPEGESVKTARSCIWTSVIILQAFTNHTRLKKSTASSRSAEFVLESFLKTNTTTLFPQPDAWDHLYRNYTDNGLFRGGTLRFLEALAPLHETHDHRNFKKALDWLREQQLPSGLFPAIANRTKEGDYWVTYRVTKLLKTIAETTE